MVALPPHMGLGGITGGGGGFTSLVDLELVDGPADADGVFLNNMGLHIGQTYGSFAHVITGP